MEKEIDKNSGRDMTPKLIGETFMRKATENSKEYRFGRFECPYCENTFECRISSVNSGDTKSCGCIRGKSIITHGLRYHNFYGTWRQMLQRCTNPKIKAYKNYGGRGITVCEEWLNIATFITWVEATHPNIEGMTLDRIDNDKGYSPENCRWADVITQASNKSKQINSTSGYTGVNWDRARGVWVAVLVYNKKRSKIGAFKTKEEAVLARDNYIIKNNLPHKLSTDYKREESQ